MPDVYCELCDESAAELGLSNYVTFYTDERAHPYYDRFPIALAASRIWVHDDDSIIFVKNRYSDHRTTPVDMTEFVWVKLKSVSV